VPSSVRLPGYAVVHQPATRTTTTGSVSGSTSGGLVLFIRTSLSFARLPTLCNPYCLFVRVGLPGSRSHTVVGVVYRRHADPKSLDIITKTIASAMMLELPILVFGDYNARHTSWCTISNGAGHKLVEFIDAADLTVLNESFCPQQPTWSGKGRRSTIDLVLTSNPEAYASLAPAPQLRLSSDHFPLVLTAAHPQSSPPSSAPPAPKRAPHYRWTPERADWDLFKRLLDLSEGEYIAAHRLNLTDPRFNMSYQTRVDHMWRAFRDWVFDAAVIAVGRKRCGRTNREQWYRRVPGVAEANTEFHRLHRLHCRNMTTDSAAALRSARRHFRNTCALAKQKVWDDLCSRIEKSGNSKQFWANFHATIGQPALPVSSVHHPSSGLPLNPAAAREHLASHFADACAPFPHSDTSRNSEEGIRCDLRGIDPNESDFRTASDFDVDLVTRFCRSSKLGSALGADQFSPYFFHHGSSSFYAAYTALVNFSWTHGVVPSDWRCANICALFKGHGADPSSPDSFRPISLTSIASKIMERLVLHVVRPLWSPSPQQAGFRPSHSTYDLHLRLCRILERTAQSRTHRHIAFLDFSKAFDKVNHNFLLWKLHRKGIRGRAFRWIRAFLTDRSLRVAAQSSVSSWYPVKAGVPQGAVLSPWLFLIFIDDLATSLREWVECLLYADDVALAPHRGGRLGDNDLRHALTLADLWARTWGMAFNHKKSQIVQFSRISALTLPRAKSSFPLGFVTLRIVDTYRYLGLIYDSRWSWVPQFASMLTRASRCSHLISRIITPGVPIGIRAISSLIRGMLIPLMTYGCPFWRLRVPQRKKLNALLTRPLTRALRLPSTAHHLSVLIECGIPDIHTEWELLTIQFINRSFGRLHTDLVYQLINAPLDWTVPKYSLIPTARCIANRWNLNWKWIQRSMYSSKKLRRVAHQRQTVGWRADGQCKGYVALRLIERPDPRQQIARFPAQYLLHDDSLTASIRARLRLNRSFPNDSQYRRYMIPSPACSCGAVLEDVRHLLFCRLYRSARLTIDSARPRRSFVRDPSPTSSSTSVLLGELISLYMTPPDRNRRRHYLHSHEDNHGEPRVSVTRVCRNSLDTTGEYLRAVASTRPGSI
jgi:hypothetical protein